MELQEFIEKVLKPKKSKFIMFCGAGISRDSGIPGVEEFNKLKCKIDFGKLENNANKKMIFWRNLFSPFSFNTNHMNILRLADEGYFDTIVSSNYDVFIEQCIADKFPHWKREIKEQSCIEKKYDNNKKIIKIHGDVEQQSVSDINILTLTVGKEIDEATSKWDKIFEQKPEKLHLWVIGYSGKEEDNGFKLICKSAEKFEKIYWMYIEKDEIAINEELDRIKSKICSDKIEFIPIKGANQVFTEINKILKLTELKCKSTDNKFIKAPEKYVAQAYEIANKTIDLLEKIDSHVTSDMKKAQGEFDEILSMGEKLNIGSVLYVLRRYNSYTPILPMRDIDSKGGGYFLVHNNKGIVIDPGYDFLDNFFNCSYDEANRKCFKINHIDAVVITHAHNDHYGELDSLLNMLFQYNKKVKLKNQLSKYFRIILNYTNSVPNSENLQELIKNAIKDDPLHNEAKYALELLKSPDEEKRCILHKYIEEVEEEKSIDLYISRSAYKAVEGIIPLESKTVRNVYILNPGDKVKYEDIDIEAIPVKHQDLYSKSHSIGLKFTLKIGEENILIGFTSDTGYFQGLEDSFRDCDVLIPHIGSIKPKELDIYPSNNELNEQLNEQLNEHYHIPYKKSFGSDTAFYENHLGIIGLCTLIAALKSGENSKLKVCIISEYGEEMKRFRHKITSWLNELYKDQDSKFKVITGDIGLRVDFKAILHGTWSIKEVVNEGVKKDIHYTYKNN